MRPRFLLLLALALSVLVHEPASAQAPPAGAPGGQRVAARRAAVRIGNYFVDSPYGIAIVAGERAAFLIDPVWDEKGGKTSYGEHDAALVAPATTAPDFSYMHAEFRHRGASIRFTWGRVGADGVAARFVADRKVALTLRLPTTWPQSHTIYTAAADGLTGYGIEPSGRYIPFVLRTDPAPAAVRANVTAEAEVVLALEPGRVTRLVAGLGTPPALEAADALVVAGERYAARRVAAEGEWGDFAGAIADNMNNARLYGSDNGRVAYACGRGWWLAHQKDFEGNADLFPYFLWDYFFHGILGSLEDPQSARDTVRAVLSFQTPAGFVPSFSHWGAEGHTYVTLHRSMPPIGAMAVWKMYERWPDARFLAEVFPRLARWHAWWPKARDGNHNGLLEWGSEQRWWQGAQYETGWDDNVHFEGAAVLGRTMTMNADAVDLTALWSMDAEYLAKIAAALGRTSEARRFTREHEATNRLINGRLWNEELGIYCSRLWAVPEVEAPALPAEQAFPGGFDAAFFGDAGHVVEATRRQDPTIDFKWGRVAPAPGMAGEGWSARWTGRFVAPRAGRFRLRIDGADAARLEIAGKAVEDWQFGDDTKAVDLDAAAGDVLPIALEYVRPPAGEPASLRLSAHPLSPGRPGSDWLTRLTPMNFYPLICGAPDAGRAARALQWLYREDKFWLPWLVPTVAKDDPVWPAQSYWHGHVWPPANYLVWLAVQRYGDSAHQAEYARRSVALFMRNWKDKRLNCENYRSTDGGCGNDPHYTWGTLLPLIGVEAFASVGADLRPVPRDVPIAGSITLRRIPFGGRLYRIEAANGKVTVSPESQQPGVPAPGR